MRNAAIPAQIITVEDKIAGNLTLTQIVILMIPLIITMILYITIPPFMKFSTAKIIVSVCIALLFLLLAVRFKGKIVTQWISILLRYTLRPGLYLYNKNDPYQRTISLPIIKQQRTTIQAKEETESVKQIPTQTITDRIRLEKLLTDKTISLRFKTTKKGGLTIALNQIT